LREGVGSDFYQPVAVAASIRTQLGRRQRYCPLLGQGQVKLPSHQGLTKTNKPLV